MISEKDKKVLLKLARDAVFNEAKAAEVPKGRYRLLVSIYTKDKELRGRIGLLGKEADLKEGIIKAARLAAFNDLRFDPVKENEKIIFSISLLSKPEIVKNFEEIEIGRHGLIAEIGSFYGIMLPEKAVENNWSREEFLNNVCIKAGLLEDTWREGGCKIYKFEVESFEE